MSKMYEITINKKTLENDIRDNLSYYYAKDYDKDILNEHIKEKVESLAVDINQFAFICQDDFDHQVKKHGEEAYFGESSVGDLLWFDGEVYCDASCLKDWCEMLVSKDCNLDDAVELTKYCHVISILNSYNEDQKAKHLLENGDLTLSVRVNSKEDVEQLMDWMYAPEKPMTAELIELAWNKAIVSKEEAELLDKMRKVLAYR